MDLIIVKAAPTQGPPPARVLHQPQYMLNGLGQFIAWSIL